jgi:REP element-mobilizing transposase RayT
MLTDGRMSALIGYMRLKVRGRNAVYHCVSRTVNRERLFDSAAKEQMRKQIHRVADFCGVEVITYSVMSNHFHVLVRVPDAAEAVVSDEEILRRYRVLYPKPTAFQVARIDALRAHLRAGGVEGDLIRRKLLVRMHDISEFMKTLKQRFSVWYNKVHGRVGTLWSERFKSTLVEGKGHAVQIVGAYVDLNPVRAGLVKDPTSYRWSGYGEAMGGSVVARRGIMRAIGCRHENAERDPDWREAQRDYRLYLYCAGTRSARGKEGSSATFSHTSCREEMARGGEVPIAEALRCRIRYFTEGAILGSREYVRDTFASLDWESKKKGNREPRGMFGSDWQGMTVLRGKHRGLFR